MKVRLLVSALALVLMGGCSLTPGSEVKLGVPHRAQEQFNYCVPACVLMWRLYDGLGPVSQTTIFNWMGGAGCTTTDRAADAVSHFTNTFDAQGDGDYASNYKQMISRQVTSIDQRTPVIAVINDDHTVVLQGGKWHQEGPNYMWDSVLINDPDPVWGGPEQRLAASTWLQEFCPPNAAGYVCLQVISASAASTWQSNYNMYKDNVVLYGTLDPDNQW